MQQRCAAAYEKKVGLIQNWLELQGHVPFAHWVESSDQGGMWSLHLIVDDENTPSALPRLPTVESICEWALALATLLVVHSRAGRESIALARGMEVWVG